MNTAAYCVSMITTSLAIAAATAGPTGKHETCSAHFPSEDIWTSSSSWTGSPPSSQSVDNTVLTTGWSLDSSALVSAHMMFDHVAMDGAMNPLSVHTHDDISLYQIQLTRSAPGTPLTMQMTIDSEVTAGPDGFLMELASPVTLTMERVGFSGVGVPGQFIAHYEGVYQLKELLITDPGIDMTPRVYIVDEPTVVEIELLTDQMPCSPADIAEPFGQLTFGDISGFIAAFSAGLAAGDIAAPFGQFTFGDISAFIAAFSSGCP
jgi:hypothetical protein